MYGLADLSVWPAWSSAASRYASRILMGSPSTPPDMGGQNNLGKVYPTSLVRSTSLFAQTVLLGAVLGQVLLTTGWL